MNCYQQPLMCLALVFFVLFGATAWARDPFYIPKTEAQQVSIRWYSLKFASPKDVSMWLEKSKGALSKGGRFGADLSGLRLWFVGTPEQQQQIKLLLGRLDRPQSQVLVSARIVRINRDAERALGVRWGVHTTGHEQKQQHGSFDKTREKTAEDGDFSLHLGTLPGGQSLDLALRAMEEMGVGEILAKPRLIVSQGEEASIESGHKIPYQQRVGREETAIKFEKAVLGVKVRAKQLPGGRIALDLHIHQDKPLLQKMGLAPNIETQVIHTHVVVKNGHTIVLGGIVESTSSSSTAGVPLLSRIPVLGRLFRYHCHHCDRSELMLYLQPRLLVN